MIDWAKHWWAGVVDHLPDLGNGVVVLLVGIALAWAARLSIRRVGTRWGVEPASRMLVSRSVFLVLLAIFSLIAISVGFPGIDVGAMIGALGVTSLIIGFALKDVVENFVSGFFILSTKPFDIGDQIVSGDHEGTVEAIQFRATFLRTYDNRRIVIPNSELYTNRVEVNTAFDKRRFSVEVTFPNEFAIPPVQQALLDVAASIDEILTDPAPEALAVTTYDYANAVTLRYWLTPATSSFHLHVLSKLNTAIDFKLGDLGIGNPRPEFLQVIYQDRKTKDVAGRLARNAEKDA